MESKFKIRPYLEKDFPTLLNWWIGYKEVPPTKDLMPKDSSFVIESEDKPVASMCLIYTNLPATCYCAHFISDPTADSDVRREAVREIFSFIKKQAKDRGYERLLAFGYQPKLTDRFQALGFRLTLQSLNSFVLDL